MRRDWTLLFVAALALGCSAPLQPEAAESAPEHLSPAEPALFSTSDVTDTPRIRFSLDDGPIIEPIAAVVVPSTDTHPLAIQGRDAAAYPAVYFEVGRGAGALRSGVYGCAEGEAAALVLLSDRDRLDTVETSTCTVTIDVLASERVSLSVPVDAPFAPQGGASVERLRQRILGRVDALVVDPGPGPSEVRRLRITYAATFYAEMNGPRQ